MLKYVFMLDSQNVNFLVNIFRMCVSVLCYALYNLVSGLFQVIFYLANFDLLRLADDMADRIYIILGIFMLFKITLSLLNYLVSPDKISDKEVGASKLIMRVVLSLVMLVALPTGFEMLTEVQNQVLPVIPRVILGKDVGMTTGRTDLAIDTAESMTLPIVRAFASSATGCDTKFEASDAKDVLDNAIEKCPEDKSIYLIDYHGLISLIVAVLMVYVTFSLAISVAIRAFKLIILRVIAPAPIVSYIDPKSSKSDGMFSKWSKMLLSTWAELLINLAIIYFIIFMIMELFPNADGVSILANNGIPDGFIGGLVIAFLIIGLLMFAKDAPKFLMDALGLKSAGGFGRMLGMGATALGGIGSARNALQSRHDYEDLNGEKRHHLRNLGAALGAGIGGLSTGGHALLTDKDGKFLSGVDAQGKYNSQVASRNKNGITLGNRLTDFGNALFAGNPDPGNNFEQEISGYDKAFSAMKALTDTAEDKFKTGNMQLDYFKNGKAFSYRELEENSLSARNGDEAANKWLIDHGFGRTERRVVGEKSYYDGDELIKEPVYEDYQVGDFTAALLARKEVAEAGANEMIKIASKANDALEKYGADSSEYTAITANSFYDGTVSGKHSDAKFAVKQAHFSTEIDLSTRSGAKKGQGVASNESRRVKQSDDYLRHQKKNKS